MQASKLYCLLILAMMSSGCGGGANQPTQAQRAALAQPLFETEFSVIERTDESERSKANQIARTASYNKMRNAYF